MAFKMKGSAFKLNNIATKSALKQLLPTTHTAYIDGKKVVTKTHEGRENEEGLSQKQVLDNAYAKIEEANLNVNEFNKDPRFKKELSQEEYDALTNEQNKIYKAYDSAAQDYSAVSDSLTNVNLNYK